MFCRVWLFNSIGLIKKVLHSSCDSVTNSIHFAAYFLFKYFSEWKKEKKTRKQTIGNSCNNVNPYYLLLSSVLWCTVHCDIKRDFPFISSKNCRMHQLEFWSGQGQLHKFTCIIYVYTSDTKKTRKKKQKTKIKNQMWKMIFINSKYGIWT